MITVTNIQLAQSRQETSTLLEIACLEHEVAFDINAPHIEAAEKFLEKHQYYREIKNRDDDASECYLLLSSLFTVAHLRWGENDRHLSDYEKTSIPHAEYKIKSEKEMFEQIRAELKNNYSPEVVNRFCEAQDNIKQKKQGAFRDPNLFSSFGE